MRPSRRNFFLLFAGAVLSAFPGGCFSLPEEAVFEETQSNYAAIVEIKSYAVEGRTIAYAEAGKRSAPLILFVHGTPGSWRAYAHFMADPDLREIAHLIAVDRPGFGNSSEGGVEKSIRKQSALLRPLLDLNKSAFGTLLVGHSLGGPIIARMAMDYPGEVGGLLMLAPGIDPELGGPRWYNIAAAWTPAHFLLAKSLKAANREIMPLRGELKEMLPLWKNLEMPVTHIHGLKDQLVSPGNAAFSERVLVRADLKVLRLPEGNHFILWTRPELIKATLLEMLEKLRKRTSNQSAAVNRGSS